MQKAKAADFSYKSGKLGKLMKVASGSSAKYCIIFGQEFDESSQLVIKNLETGEQEIIDYQKMLDEL